MEHLIRTFHDRLPPPLYFLSYIYLLLHLPPCGGARSRRRCLTTQFELKGIERRLLRALLRFEMLPKSVSFSFFLVGGLVEGAGVMLEDGHDGGDILV